MVCEYLHIYYDRTGQKYQIPIIDGSVSANDIRQITSRNADRGLLIWDPGLSNTAWCRSGITSLDPLTGTLLYRGYPIDQLVEQCTYIEVAYLLLEGELPKQHQLSAWLRTLSSLAVPDDVLAKIIMAFP